MTIVTTAAGILGGRWRVRPGKGPVTLARRWVSARTWLATAHLLVGPIAGLLTIVVFLVLTVVTLGCGIRIAARAALAVQESRFATFLRVRITPVPEASYPRTWREKRSRSWPTAVRKQVVYYLYSGVGGVVYFLATVVTWSTVPALGMAMFLDTNRSLPRMTLVGAEFVILLLAVPWAIDRMATLDTAVARALLKPDSTNELTQRIESLTASRADVVAAATAERRRIERDLHDGAQQRLVSLAIHLGITRASATDLPEPTRKAIANAHDEAKQALVELRDFVRGLHPAILDELGLDAALSGVTARCPVPVHLTTDLPQRLPSHIEQVAYFVISEALTNVAKHAQASSVEVVVRHLTGTDGVGSLSIVIRDDGKGGARPDAGGGLGGLDQRVRSVDGTFRLDSPEGGPTIIDVELPCEL